MKKPRYSLIALILMTAVLPFFASNVFAVGSGVQAIPASRVAPFNAASAVPASWRYTRVANPGQATVESAAIEVRLGSASGTLLSTINKNLSRTQVFPNSVDIVNFSETISLPRDLVGRASKAGQPLYIVRNFTENGYVSTISANIKVSFGSSSSSSFDVQSVELTFDNGTTSCIAKPGDKRVAVATIASTGTGQLHGSWQIRKGGSFGSFSTLKTVNTVLVSGRATKIESPELPLDESERLDVRLVIDSPAISYSVPQLTCDVSGKGVHNRSEKDIGKQAKVIAPAKRGLINATTEISWEPVKGAKAYRVEIITEENGEPVAAQMVKAGTTKAKPSALTVDKLNSTDYYFVRVIAE